MTLLVMLISFLMLCGNDGRCADVEVNTWEEVQEQEQETISPAPSTEAEAENEPEPAAIGPYSGIGYPWAGVTEWDTGYCPLIDGDGWNGYGRLTWPVVGGVLHPEEIFRVGHTGIDIDAPEGTPVEAAAPGYVVWAGKSTYGFGQLVVLAHGNGWLTFYAHMLTVWGEDDGDLALECGQWVPAGRSLGLVGQTGAAQWPHLHFEVRQGWLAYNPLMYLD